MSRPALRVPASPAIPASAYDVDCRRCARLSAFLETVHDEHPAYFCRPVPPFGDATAKLVVVGLAPGMHGANATGRPFTGDYAGILLYRTLHKYGFASSAESVSAGDGLVLRGARITNAVKCLPPGNKPMPVEIRNCNAYLAAELSALPDGAVLLALGRIAHDATLLAINAPARAFAFAHGARHEVGRGVVLFDSYHCSRYNTNTGRLSVAMFEEVFARIAVHLCAGATAV